ncbi:MAG: glycosyltransferase [Deltaproteobacteria bacterium]
MADGPVTASVIVLNYKKEGLTIECIRSVLAGDMAFDSYEVIVVDNGSTDDGYALLEKTLGGCVNVTLLRSEKNLGFAGGCNLAVEAAKGRYLVFLNNDTLVPRNWLSGLVLRASETEAGIIGTKMCFADGEGCINNAGSYLTSRGDAGDIGFGEKDEGQYDYPRDVFAACGGNMLVKREVIDAVGAFDERFFVYYEDIDLCYRARLAGFRVRYFPCPSIVHYHAQTSVEWSPFFTFHVLRNRLFVHMKNSGLLFALKVFLNYLLQIAYEVLFRRTGIFTHVKVLASVARHLPGIIRDRVRNRFFLKKVGDLAINKLMERLPRRKKKAADVKRIIVFNRHLDTLGGGESSTVLVARALADIFQGASVEIATLEKDVLQYGTTRVDSRERLEAAFDVSLSKRVSVRRINTPLQSLFDNSKGRPAGIAFFFLVMHIELAMFMLRRLSRRSDVFVNHSFNDEFRPRGFFNLYLCMFPHAVRNKGFTLAYNKVLSISEFTLEHVRRRWGCASAMLYPYAIDKPPELRGFDKKERLIVSVGRFFRHGHSKRQDVIIEAFKSLRKNGELEGWRLCLIGRFAERDRAYVDELKMLGTGSEVEFMTDISEDVKNAVLDRAMLYVHAAGYGLPDDDENAERMEHFGISVVEAKLRGVVPIVINRGGPKELVEDGVDGFRFDTIEGLAERLRCCANDVSMLERLSGKARDSAVERFSFDAYKVRLKSAMAGAIDFGAV